MTEIPLRLPSRIKDVCPSVQVHKVYCFMEVLTYKGMSNGRFDHFFDSYEKTLLQSVSAKLSFLIREKVLLQVYFI